MRKPLLAQFRRGHAKRPHCLAAGMLAVALSPALAYAAEPTKAEAEIDTPGVREFGLAIDDPDSLAEVLEISDYAASCHFKDCKHINEPGCAVLEAVSSGVLDRKVYESYLESFDGKRGISFLLPNMKSVKGINPFQNSWMR